MEILTGFFAESRDAPMQGIDTAMEGVMKMAEKGCIMCIAMIALAGCPLPLTIQGKAGTRISAVCSSAQGPWTPHSTDRPPYGMSTYRTR